MKSIWKYAVFSVKKSKTLKIMRLLMIFCFFFISGAMANSYSQEQVVSLDLHKCDVNTLCQEIWKQTGLRFIYNEEHVKNLKAFDVKADNRKVQEVLDEVFKNTSLRYFFENDIIYIVNKQKDEPEKKEGKSISGTVKDRQKNPLPGVTVLIKGTSVGVVTDVNGNFKITLPQDTVTFIFSFVGMKRQEVKYTPGKKLDIVMDEDVEEMEEVVITGYQKIDKRHLTSAVTTLKVDDINVAGISTIDKMLEGHVPGMIFMQNSGQVGAAPKLRIRGSSTVLGSREPLWVLDGIILHDPVNVDPSQINDLDFVNLLGNAISGLNPDDIEQIDVLKDASATALYGTRAANGVIVITTKKGKVGPPSISYSFTGSLSRRPRYTDREVNVMNSKERMAFSRELVGKGMRFTRLDSWVGYEAAISDFWDGKLTYDEFQNTVSRYETVNTDWFDLLTRDAFSHKHTLSLSGGTENIRYYGSLGVNNEKGVNKGEKNETYSVALNLTANYNRFSTRIALQANVGEKQYTPSDVGLFSYAFNTSRTIPAYNEDGTLFYYDRTSTLDGLKRFPFSILNEMENTSDDIRSNAVTMNTSVDYKVTDYLKASATLSYSVSNTNEETYFGERSFYANCLRDAGYTESGKVANYMPYGGEVQLMEARNNAYTARLQVDFNKFLDDEGIHLLTAAVGGELSSSRYRGFSQTRRCYMPERGEAYASVDVNKYPVYADWLANDEAALGKRTNSLTNMISGYFTASYSYRDRYVLTFNMRGDASNKFGSKSNNKFLPIWALAGRWNIKDDLFAARNWVNLLAMRMSFGYQGNMLDSQTPELIIKRGTPNSQFDNKYESTVHSFPNPFLKWEKTASLNVGLDFSFLNDAIKGTVSYYYKKTKDAFLNKTVSEINGITNYMINKGTLENQGWEFALNFVPFNPQGGTDNFRWSIDPQIGQVLNKLIAKAINNQDKVVRDEVTYSDYLSGNVEIPGRPLDSFYSYKFKGLDPNDGRPIFYDVELENKEKFEEMDKEDVYKYVMDYSGCRVPTLQGSISNKLSYKRYVLAFNLSYSLGSKIRLLKLYPNIGNAGTIAPQPHENARREFLKRWQKSGDENYTNIPGILYGSAFDKTMNSNWWSSYSYSFGDNLWSMYDNSDVRVVSGNYLKLTSVSFRYLFSDRVLKALRLKSAYFELTGTNLFTISAKELKGQDPATQSGSANTINMSLRPTYSCRLNITF
ncbi:SusC/RagA family TonB-linked outer membrane protein [Butyricimonas sp.]|uniref:SusC/RagA family TonB-linked outer membrane protein n=1 Tax=Butyricimonas sp. TaxID=1969738 RepID=UPI0025C5233B|nr:SusC/RagA family TonB-linked outer membrane protein [Butyricimonas sp.]